MASRRSPESGGPKALTRIPMRIHCGATPTEGNAASEAEQIMIDHFLETLTEVAMAVAQRQAEATDRGEAA